MNSREHYQAAEKYCNAIARHETAADALAAATAAHAHATLATLAWNVEKATGDVASLSQIHLAPPIATCGDCDHPMTDHSLQMVALHRSLHCGVTGCSCENGWEL